MKEDSLRMRVTGKLELLIQMVKFTQGSTKLIIGRVLVSISGQTVSIMKENGKTICKKVMVHFTTMSSMMAR